MTDEADYWRERAKKAERVLAYITRPTMGIGPTDSAADVAMNGDERAVRFAFSNCIHMAEDVMTCPECGHMIHDDTCRTAVRGGGCGCTQIP